jgi:FlaA1/EpsC-like NDP-sugar epimerase
MARGGEIFMLDMGDPIKILDLAKDMIKRHGLQVRSSVRPHGDIEIVFTGLRLGDKLTEELPLDWSPTATSHHGILRVEDPIGSVDAVARGLAELKTAIAADDAMALRKAMSLMIGSRDPAIPSPAVPVENPSG